jgi:arginase
MALALPCGARLSAGCVREMPLNQRPLQLVLSQGRIDDRTPNAILGAALTAKAVGERLGVDPKVVGSPSPHKIDDWRASLQAAESTLVGIATAIGNILSEHHVPVLATSSCAASLATLPVAVARIPQLRILWVDAHGDFNTPETTATGYLGGMALAGACGIWDSGHGAGIDPKRILIAGVREIDLPEMKLLERGGVHLLSPPLSTPAAIEAFIGDAPIWIHIDWDVLEPGHVPTAYPVDDGLLPAELRAILQTIRTEQVAGIELVELEAPEEQDGRTAALSTLIDIISPLLDRATSV